MSSEVQPYVPGQVIKDPPGRDYVWQRDLPVRSGGLGFTRPDFVMAGARLPDGRVRLIASDKVSHAELNAEYDWARIDDGMHMTSVPAGSRIALTARVGTFTIVEADDYPTAIAEMALVWKGGA